MEDKMTIKSVTKSDGLYYIVTNEGRGFGIEDKYDIEPKEGDEIVLHTKNFTIIRGLDINGVRVFYKTDEQLKEEYKEICAKLTD